MKCYCWVEYTLGRCSSGESEIFVDVRQPFVSSTPATVGQNNNTYFPSTQSPPGGQGDAKYVIYALVVLAFISILGYFYYSSKKQKEKDQISDKKKVKQESGIQNDGGIKTDDESKTNTDEGKMSFAKLSEQVFMFDQSKGRKSSARSQMTESSVDSSAASGSTKTGTSATTGSSSYGSSKKSDVTGVSKVTAKTDE